MISSTSDNLEPEKTLNSIATGSSSSDRTQSPSVVKLRKIPPIPVRHRVDDNGEDANEDDDHESGSETSSTNEASTLGLNHIRTRSAPSPLRICNSIVTPLDVDEYRGRDGVDNLGSKSATSVQKSAAHSSEQGWFHVLFYPVEGMWFGLCISIQNLDLLLLFGYN